MIEKPKKYFKNYFKTSDVVKQIKPPLGMPTTLDGVAVWILAAQFLILLLMHLGGQRPMSVALRPLAPTQETWMEFEAPGFPLELACPALPVVDN